jgi:hypothetical protein
MTVPPESVLFNIACDTRPVFERVLGTARGPTGLKDSELGLRPLAIAAQQLQAAHVGAQIESLVRDPSMEPALRRLATDYGSAAQATLNLAVRCSVTAVDLCVAAVGRLCGTWPKPNGHEADTGILDRRAGDFVSADPAVAHAVQVLRLATAASDWVHIIDLRDHLTHRNVVQGVTGYIGPPPDPPVFTFAHLSALFAGTQVPLDELTRTIVDHAEHIFRDVCAALI